MRASARSSATRALPCSTTTAAWSRSIGALKSNRTAPPSGRPSMRPSMRRSMRHSHRSHQHQRRRRAWSASTSTSTLTSISVAVWAFHGADGALCQDASRKTLLCSPRPWRRLSPTSARAAPTKTAATCLPPHPHHPLPRHPPPHHPLPRHPRLRSFTPPPPPPPSPS